MTSSPVLAILKLQHEKVSEKQANIQNFLISLFAISSTEKFHTPVTMPSALQAMSTLTNLLYNN